MQLADLIAALVEEAVAVRPDLAAQAALIGTGGEESAAGSIEAAAMSYADFCARIAGATRELGLSGLSNLSSAIAEGLAMAGDLPLELRASSHGLLAAWPGFLIDYLAAWRVGRDHDDAATEMTALVAAAEYLTPLDDSQRTELHTLLRMPPSLTAQQAALTPAFKPLSDDALSLAVPEDADHDVVEGFLAEGPALVQRLTELVGVLRKGRLTPAQLELAHRTAHTIKGTAAIAGVRGVATLSHDLEDVLEACRDEDFEPSAEMVPALVAGADALEGAIEHLAGEADVPPHLHAVGQWLHAWAAQVQGQDVPDEHLASPAVLRTGARPDAPRATEIATAAQTLAPASDSGKRSDVAPAIVASQPQAELAPNDDEAQIRVPVGALDRMFRAVNELAVGLARLRAEAAETRRRLEAVALLEDTANSRLADIQQRIDADSRDSVARTRAGQPQPKNAIGDDRAEFDALELDRHDELSGATHALAESIVDLRQARIDLSPGLDSITTQLQKQLEFAREARHQLARSRLRPLSDLRARLRRTVRQTCVATGHEADIEITGDDLRVDAAVLGPLSEALLHLLRNGVDHGIESPRERIAAGKAAAGTIHVEFSASGSGVVTTITDDGRGLDHEAILDKAIWSGLVAPDVELTFEQIGRLIFLPGFSTRDEVTETSGRGVGLDVVAQAVASLQGSIGVQSTRGAGSVFRLFVLASVGTVHAMHVEAGGEHFLVPSTQIVRADAGADAQAPDATDPDRLWLPRLLHGDAAPADARARPSLVVDVDGLHRVVQVDRVVEAREFLLSPAPRLIDRLPGVGGVSMLSDGSLALALDLPALVRKPLPVDRAGAVQLRAAVKEQRHVLVVDDSASVRNTIGALLRDADYRVSTARDGLEAMKLVMNEPFSVVLTDLEMPQMNGFELTDYIRNRSTQPEVPVIMLTSRGQEKHRLRARRSGVDDFLVKPYADQELVDAVRTAIATGRRGDAAPGEDKNNVLEEAT